MIDECENYKSQESAEDEAIKLEDDRRSSKMLRKENEKSEVRYIIAMFVFNFNKIKNYMHLN